MIAPKFTLRDWFWLIAVIALGLAWWLERSPRQSRLDVVETELRKKFEVYLLLVELHDAQEKVYIGSEPISPERRERIKAILEGTFSEP